MRGASLSARLCREGRGEGERERSDFTFLPFSPCRCRENTCLHFTPGKRTRGARKGWDRYLEEKKEEEGGGGGFLKKEKTRKKNCFQDEWGINSSA